MYSGQHHQEQDRFYDCFYNQFHQRQQQHQRKLWLLSQYHRRQSWLFYGFSGQKSSRQRLFHIYLIRFLLLLVCYGCQTRAMEYSQELNKCFDQILANSDKLPTTTENTPMDLSTTLTTFQSERNITKYSGYPYSINRTVTSTNEEYSKPTFASAWKCCCWNSKEQVKLVQT